MSAADDPLQYMTGFDNEHASEALPGALPIGQNAPQKVRCGVGTGGTEGDERPPGPAAPRSEYTPLLR